MGAVLDRFRCLRLETFRLGGHPQQGMGVEQEPQIGAGPDSNRFWPASTWTREARSHFLAAPRALAHLDRVGLELASESFEHKRRGLRKHS